MNIHTLIPDIYARVTKKDNWFTEDISADLSQQISRRLQVHFNEDGRKPHLRLSGLGPMCPCALWYSIHHPEMAEPLPAPAVIKYSYGHVLEALAISLAKAAGHTVTGEQDELVVDGVVGHRDCVIDGCIVDIKSTSSIGFNKFKDKSLAQNDSFGYLDQLDGYLVGSLSDPLVSNKEHAYILAIDKTLGKMVLYEHRVREMHIRLRIEQYRSIIEQDKPPLCKCGTVGHGAAGNIKLDTRASYSAWKHCCFPNLRTFLYAEGPLYLTKVVRVPDVPEVDKNGKLIYN